MACKREGPARNKIGSILIKKCAFFLVLIVIAGCKKELTNQEIVPPSGLQSQYMIRVLLKSNIQQCTFSCQNKFEIIDSKTNQLLMVMNKPDKKIKIKILNGRLFLNNMVFNQKIFKIKPENKTLISINGNQYRGDVTVSQNDDGSFDIINSLEIELYLAGVIAAEMPDYWEPQALQAQTVAARTYCLYIKKRFGDKRKWDLKCTQASQKYLGVKAESKNIDSAIKKTKGQVLTVKLTENNGKFRIGKTNRCVFPTYYSAVCGGRTENSQNVFGDSFEPLCGVKCPYCKKTAKPKLLNWTKVSYDIKQINERLMARYQSFKKLEKIKKVSIKHQTNMNKITRACKIEITGENNLSDWLRAEDFRLAIDPTGTKIKSDAFEMLQKKNIVLFKNGKGYGHAVGMCQYGALAMARKNKSYKKILEFYYPNSKLIHIYK